MLTQLDRIEKIRANIQIAFQGSPQVIDYALIGLLSGGHLLIEDVPGVGKTTLAKAIAQSVGGTFRRIQFTPDLLPADVLGVNVYSPKTGEFHFKKGPVFTNILLADELNRTSPRTQASLLECMNETQVSIDGETYPLERPFLVIATQNPYEFDGTYPLPESQLDRFLLKFNIGYPSRSAQKKMLANSQIYRSPSLEPVAQPEDILQLQKQVEEVEVCEEILEYILDIVEESRKQPHVIGVSPRGMLYLRQAAQALALLRGRSYCIPDDIKELAVPVLSHRLIFTKGLESENWIRELLEKIPPPR
ncbi:MAG: MoxR family ATPase [Planctomycetota bacterium]|nr:MAG: MoxR family ATPase [Planctomycetota bacterium]